MKKSRRGLLKLTGIGVAGTEIWQPFTIIQGKTSKNNRAIVDSAVATLEDGSVISIPFWRVDSGKDGPSLLLIAAQHGNEVQGAEVARRFKEICANRIRAGSVWLIPMAELRGIRIRRYTVESQPDLRVQDKAFHRSWPGNPDGNDTERIAYTLDQAVVRHCSHAMDMHCWEHVNAAETLAEKDNESSRALGDVTATRFISYRNTSMPKSENMSFSQLVLKRGASFTVMELSGQYQMQERQVLMGLSSMVNIAKLLGMIEGEPEQIKPRVVRTPETSHELHAPDTGIFMPALQRDKKRTLMPEDFVEEGQQIGHIIRESDLVTVPVIAPVSGYMWLYGLCHWGLCDDNLPAQHPYTEEGELIAVIVTEKTP